MPRLTVAMPVYNAMPYLPQAVESILGQTLRDFHFLIIDDGSTDSSGEYLDSIDDSRVTVVHQENRGVGVTANRTFQLSETEYYARMDADDVCHPKRLELQLRHMESRPEVGLLGTQVRFIVGNREIPGPKKPLTHEMIGEMLFRGVYAICQGSLMMRAAIARQIGGYRVAGAGEDHDFFLRVHEVARIENLPEVLYSIRVRSGSLNFAAQENVQWGRAYAICCAQCRRHGRQEPSLAEFSKQWQNRSLVARLRDRVDVWSVVQYRKALLELGNGQYMLGRLRLALAAMCRPAAVWRRIFGFSFSKPMANHQV